MSKDNKKKINRKLKRISMSISFKKIIIKEPN